MRMIMLYCTYICTCTRGSIGVIWKWMLEGKQQIVGKYYKKKKKMINDEK